MMLKVLFVGFLISAVEVYGEEGTGYCANPVMESENIVDIQFIHDHYKGGWNTQFGNPYMRKRAAQLLQGTDTPNETENPDELCMRTTFDILDLDHMIGSITGQGGLAAKWNCSNENHVFECTFYSSKNKYESRATVHLVYFDGNENHNAAALAMCDGNDIVAWAVLSISKTLSDKETKLILDRFKSVGFNPEIRVPLRSENCP